METFYHNDISLKIFEGIYCPAEDSLLLAEYLEKQDLQGKNVLEVGTGSGFVSIVAAKKGAEVDACDINPDAIECAEINAKSNNAKINFFTSDLFSNVKGSYDIIIFNPPYLPEDEDDSIAGKDIIYSGGKEGKETIERFLKGAHGYLKKGGYILLITSSLTGKLKHSFSSEVVARKKVWMEELILHKLKIKG